MSVPVEITIRNIEKTPAIEQDILKKANKICRFHDRIEFIKVVVNMPQNNKHNGKLYSVMVETLVPGRKFVVNRNRNEDLYVAIRDAFNAMRQQLKNHSRKIQGTVKTHSSPLTGKVVRLYNDYGFIESSDGTEFYFNSGRVNNGDFQEINEGNLVRFLETEAGSEGLQAAHVSKLPKAA